VRQPANPQQYGLLGSGDPRVWTAAENIMAQPGMQYGQSPGLLAQPPGQGGGGLLSNTPSGQAQAMPMGQMQGSPSGARSGGLDYFSQLPPEMISVMSSQQQPQGMDPMQGNQVHPVTPSGIWDANPDPNATSEAATAPGFTNRQMFQMMNSHLMGGDPMEQAGQKGANMEMVQHLMNGGNGGANGGVFGSEGNGTFSPVNGWTETDWDAQYDPSLAQGGANYDPTGTPNMADWYTSFIRNNSGSGNNAR
jgi:hypothetical protein